MSLGGRFRECQNEYDAYENQERLKPYASRLILKRDESRDLSPLTHDIESDLIDEQPI